MAAAASTTRSRFRERSYSPPRLGLIQGETTASYIDAAQAVASFAATACAEHSEIVATDALTIGVFDAVSLLLAHASRCLEATPVTPRHFAPMEKA